MLAGWPGEAKNRNEVGARRTVPGALFGKRIVDALHGEGEVLSGAGPAGGVDAGCAVEICNLEPRVIGERGEARSGRGGEGLEARIAFEGRLGFLGLGKVQVAGRDGIEAVRCDQFLDLPYLARVVAGDDEAAAGFELFHAPNPQMRGSANSTELPAGSRT
jgi:hypothetical protein